jgi:hypothetical protein
MAERSQLKFAIGIIHDFSLNPWFGFIVVSKTSGLWALKHHKPNRFSILVFFMLTKTFT